MRGVLLLGCLACLLLLATGAGAYFVEASAAAFVFPQDGRQALRLALDAESSIVIASYIFTNFEVAWTLIDLKSKKPLINISVLVDGSPVGGIQKEETRVLCSLAAANISVLLYGGAGHMHSKYIVADGRTVMIATENLVRSALTKNRGWGAVLRDETLAFDFEKNFLELSAISKSFEGKNCGEVVKIPRANLTSGEDGGGLIFGAVEAHAFFGPGAGFPIIEEIGAAKRSIDVAQFFAPKTWSRTTNPFLEALLAAARRGVSVRLLLDGEENAPENRATAAFVNSIALEEHLSLEARLFAASRLGLEKLHAKALLIDDEAIVSSVNWNRGSSEINAEAGVVMRGPLVKKLASSFEGDWRGEVSTGAGADYIKVLPGPVAVAILLAAVSIRIFYK